VRPNDLRELIGFRATNDNELDPLKIVRKEVRYVVCGRHRVDATSAAVEPSNARA